MPGHDRLACAERSRGCQSWRMACRARNGRDRFGHAALGQTHRRAGRRVDVVEEKLEHTKQLGADAAVDASAVDAADAIRDITGGGANVSIEALGIAQMTNASVECLATLGRHVHVGMPSGDGMMTINMRAIYSKQLSFFGTRGMPSWTYPSLLGTIARKEVDLNPMVAREVALSEASHELRAMTGPTSPGTALITDFLN